jgi:DnaJ-class molecular chaperone
MTDYYSTLGVPRECTDVEIKQAFRKAATIAHPDRAKGSREAVLFHFAQLTEAYCVLSDAKLRAIYDQYGEKLLKEGASNGLGGKTTPWAMSRTPQEVYSDFFGTTSAYADSIFVSPATETKEKKLPEIEPVNLYCSLEELYSGCTKKLKVSRQRIQSDGRLGIEDKVLTIEVKPGWKAGTKITFPKEGDDVSGSGPVDVILALREKPHPSFTRQGNDLIFTARVSLASALTGSTVSVTHLDRRVLPIAVNEIVSPGSTKIIANEGMPTAKDPRVKGNLVLQFQVDFPTELSVDQKNKIKAVLGA